MIVTAVLSILLGVASVGVLYGTFSNLRRDTWAVRARDRFFGRWFRWFWLVAGLISSYLLGSAAWLLWVNPLLAVGYVALVPLIAGGLVVSARKVLPWLYDRKLKK